MKVGAVRAGVHRAASRPRHDRLPAAAAARTHHRRGDELVGEYVDDGQSGARLDRPGLDALRDAAEAGLVRTGVVPVAGPARPRLCLPGARPRRAGPLRGHGRFTDSPALAADDPQATLLTQVQGVIAEYEKAKIAERYRRGKLFRARAGEIVTWKSVLRLPADRPQRRHRPAHHGDLRARGRRGAAHLRRPGRRHHGPRDLPPAQRRRIPSPTGKPTWGHSTLCRLLRNEAYIGRVYFNRTEIDARPAAHPAQPGRSRATARGMDPDRLPPDHHRRAIRGSQPRRHDNAKWSPRRAEPGEWLLKGLVKCGVCDVGTNCHKMRGRNGTWHRYYYCRNHDPLRAGGEDRRCPERNIRADALDEFVFDQIRAALTHPEHAAGR